MIIENQINNIIERLGERKDILSAVPRITDVSATLKELLVRMRQPIEQVDGKVMRSVQLWMCYPRIMSTEVSGSMKTFLALPQNTGEVIHIYLSTAHTSPIEGILHCYFQSLGCSHKECVVLELLAQLGCGQRRLERRGLDGV